MGKFQNRFSKKLQSANGKKALSLLSSRPDGALTHQLEREGKRTGRGVVVRERICQSRDTHSIMSRRHRPSSGDTAAVCVCVSVCIASVNLCVCPAGHHHRHHHHTLTLPTSALPEAAEGPLGRGRMVERKEPPVSSDRGEEPYVAVPSQTQPEANGKKPWNARRPAVSSVPLLFVPLSFSFFFFGHLWQGGWGGGGGD